VNKNLANKKVAILATDGFEDVELTEPKQALEVIEEIAEGKHKLQDAEMRDRRPSGSRF
jgi:serine/threonine protein phosphatase PrpC